MSDLIYIESKCLKYGRLEWPYTSETCMFRSTFSGLFGIKITVFAYLVSINILFSTTFVYCRSYGT
jgi:hypothetical protein